MNVSEFFKVQNSRYKDYTVICKSSRTSSHFYLREISWQDIQSQHFALFVLSKNVKLRFSVGDRVLACHEDEWREAVVTKLWSDEGQRKPAPYRMRVSATEDDIYTMHDENDTVRSYTELGLPRLLQSIACGDEWLLCNRKSPAIQWTLDLWVRIFCCKLPLVATQT